MNPKVYATPGTEVAFLAEVANYLYNATNCGLSESEYVADQILQIVKKYL